MADNPDDQTASTEDQVRDLEARNAKLSVLLETGQALASVISLDELLIRVMDEVTRVLDAERSSLFLLDKQRNELYSKIAQGIDDKEIRFPVGRGLAGHVAKTGELINLADAYDDSRFNPDVDRTTGYRTRSMLVMPMKNRKGQVLGVIQALNKSSGEPFDKSDIDLLSALAAQAAISIDNAFLYKQIEDLFERLVDTLVEAIDARDPITAGHSHRVAGYSDNLARALHRSTTPDVAGVEFTREQLRALRYASKLHDVGKIGVRESVLCKRFVLLRPELELVSERVGRARAERELKALRAGAAPIADDFEFYDQLQRLLDDRQTPKPLAQGERELLERAHAEELLNERQFRCYMLERGNLIDDEWLDMRSHVVQSYELLKKIPWPGPLSRVPEIAGGHHEKADGSGYPDKLRAGEYPFESEIMCVADIFDALTASDRPYKRSYSHDEARDILDDEVKLKKIDHRLVRTFFEADCQKLSETIPRPLLNAHEDPVL